METTFKYGQKVRCGTRGAIVVRVSHGIGATRYLLSPPAGSLHCQWANESQLIALDEESTRDDPAGEETPHVAPRATHSYNELWMLHEKSLERIEELSEKFEAIRTETQDAARHLDATEAAYRRRMAKLFALLDEMIKEQNDTTKQVSSRIATWGWREKLEEALFQ